MPKMQNIGPRKRGRFGKQKLFNCVNYQYFEFLSTGVYQRFYPILLYYAFDLSLLVLIIINAMLIAMNCSHICLIKFSFSLIQVVNTKTVRS